jgi:DNA-binding transcriptional regulator LsrR (DeoR family)
MMDARSPIDDQFLLLVKVASMYYEQDLSQAEIASQVRVSRSTVSRMLKEARERGIVEIIIHYPLARSVELERDLKDAFSLKAARVLSEVGLNHQDTIRRIGALAAEYLEDQLFDGAVLGIGWGFAVSQVVRAIRRPGRFPVDVVQLVGSAGQVGPERDGLEIARHLAETLGGRCLNMPAPIIVQSPAVASALLQDPGIQETLRVAEKADFAVVGIGSAEASHSTILESGYLKQEDLDDLAASGAVGDVCNRWFLDDGTECDTPVNSRVVGLDLAQLMAIRSVMAVAAGDFKIRSILGALQGRLIDVLATDRLTALQLLRSAPMTV